MKVRRVNLYGGYYVEIDDLNYVLKQEYIGISRKDDEEKEMTRFIGYFANLKSCLMRVYKDYSNDLAEEECISLAKYIECLEKSEKRVEEYVKEHCNGEIS